MNLNLNWQFWFVGPNLPKNGVFALKQKKGYHHWVSHIRINLGTEFQLKLTILILWTKFSQKGYFRSEMKKLNLCVRSWSLRAILNFSARGRQTQRYFDISSPSSRRDKYYIEQFTKTLNFFPYLVQMKIWKRAYLFDLSN